ncbi:hypothetical protein [Nocardia sp. NPDC004123]
MDNDRSAATREQLSSITGPEQLGAALRSVREGAGLSIRGLVQRAAEQRPSGRTPFRKNLIEDMEKGHRINSVDDDDRLDLYLSLCGVTAEELTEWQHVFRRVFGVTEPAGPGGTPHGVSDARADGAIGIGATRRPRAAYAVLGATAAVLCSAIIMGVHEMTSNRSTASTALYSTPPGPGFRTISGDPAQAGSPPLTVAVTTPLHSGASMGKFALPGVLDLDGAAITKFNAEVITNSDIFQRWQEDNAATPVSRGTTDLTVTNAWSEPVRIIRMSAVKQCDKPLHGTYFQPPAEGGVESNISLGVDLDAADGVFQEMYYTADGFHPAGPDYFEKNTITLAPGESQAFTIGAFVTNFSCTFKIRTFVADKNSTVFQDIDFHGKPFQVTGLAGPVAIENPYSGYGAMYVPNQSRTWMREDPRTAVK